MLVQGQGSKRQLMQRFLDAPHAVLVGSQSFWEGVDVPGEALQCVVIDKLPFPPPNDPLVEARVKRLESRGPQRVRRLLRRRGGGVAEAGRRAPDPQRDRPRPARRLRPAHGDDGLRPAAVRGLPPMTRVESEAEALAWLRELAGAPAAALAAASARALTRASTRASCFLPKPSTLIVVFGKFGLQHALGVVAQLDRGRAGRSSAP